MDEKRAPLDELLHGLRRLLSPKPPEAPAGDTLAGAVSPAPLVPGSSDVEELVDAALSAMGGAGPDAEDAYQRALAELAGHAERATAVVVDLYRRLERQRYLERWALVQLAGDLRQPQAVELFAAVIAEPVEARPPADAHAFNPLREEAVIKTTAVEHLERLTADGVDGAGAALDTAVRNPVLSVRRAAVQALVAVGGDEARERLRQHLPPGDQHLVDIRRIGAEELPPLTGERFLAGHPSRPAAGDQPKLTPSPDLAGPPRAGRDRHNRD